MSNGQASRSPQQKRYGYENMLYQAMMFGLVAGIMSGVITGDPLLMLVVAGMGMMVVAALMKYASDRHD